METVSRIRSLVRARNRELAIEAAIEAALGVLFCALTFGFIFWLTWLAGFRFGRSLGLSAVGFAMIVTGIFFVTAVVSAWRRVDPLGNLDPMTVEQQVMTELSLASPNMLYFSPRHASAGAALVILGGPVNLFSALGTWRHRLDDSEEITAAAADTLHASEAGLDLERVEAPHAALLLRRLALVKVVARNARPIVVPTEKGRGALESTASAV